MGSLREVLTGIERETAVVCCDTPGHGGACHKYEIIDKERVSLSSIRFQNGPIQDNGVNGCQNEDLLSIVRDRLEGFQSGKFSCPENAQALAAVKDAIQILNRRTIGRRDRGVEGTNQK